MSFRHLRMAGSQKVVAKDPSNKKQIALIQAHLKEESQKFRKGDFSDPAKIHGEDMPGLAELKTGSGRVNVLTRALPDGAQIRYTSERPETGDGDPSLVCRTAFRPRTPRFGHTTAYTAGN